VRRRAALHGNRVNSQKRRPDLKCRATEVAPTLGEHLGVDRAAWLLMHEIGCTGDRGAKPAGGMTGPTYQDQRAEGRSRRAALAREDATARTAMIPWRQQWPLRGFLKGSPYQAARRITDLLSRTERRGVPAIGNTVSNRAYRVVTTETRHHSLRKCKASDDDGVDSSACNILRKGRARMSEARCILYKRAGHSCHA
jgi:hypothetical protein